MPGLRIMTYNVRDFCCGRGGLSAIQAVIAAAAPDIVALQEVAAYNSRDLLPALANGLGMRLYTGSSRCGNAFLSYYPLHHLQSFTLDEDGRSLRAEIDFAKKRMEIYNVWLGGRQKREQVDSLLGEDLLGGRQQGLPALILGDFGGFYPCRIEWDPLRRLQRVSHPLVHGTYPAWLPLLARDRAYVQGDLRVFAAEVVRGGLARQASSHLPLILTIEMTDLRKYLQIPPSFSGRKLEIAAG